MYMYMYVCIYIYIYIHTYIYIYIYREREMYIYTHRPNDVPFGSLATPGRCPRPLLDTLQRGVQWMGGAVDWGSII